LYFIFGRSVYKKRTKLKTACVALQNDRAIVAIGESTMSDSPIRQVPTSIKKSRDERHVTVSFGNRGGRATGTFYANSGMDFFNRELHRSR
jgi:hypothetical protein